MSIQRLQAHWGFTRMPFGRSHVEPSVPKFWLNEVPVLALKRL